MIRRPPPLLLALLLVAATAHADDGRLAVLGAMKQELARAKERLRLPGYEPPYFIAYTLRDHQVCEAIGKFGARHQERASRNRHAFVEVRVGDDQLDHTGNPGDGVALGDPDAYDPDTIAPLDDDAAALRGALWLLTDVKYKQALAAYAEKRGRRATQVVEDESLPSFAREPAAKAVDPPIDLACDRPRLAERARRASARFKRHPEIFDAEVKLVADRLTRVFVSSEGTELISERVIYSTLLVAATRAPDGMLLEHEKAVYVATAADQPDDPALDRLVDELSRELLQLRAAPLVDPYTGPALLMPQAAGVFFHETLGHRLEGERQNDEREGRTFKGQLGQRILPEFISLHDDPTLPQALDGDRPRSLNGHYRFDDEGVAARDVALITNGVLTDYLKSRTPIVGSLRSNGHGRAEGTADPIGRMGNLILRSTRQLPEAELRRRLLAEVRRQGKPFGLIIRDIAGGSTNTTNYGFQAFKGQPRLVYRVDAKTGAESLVRGVDMVGTPLTALGKIVATSDRSGVFNGFCGAESGMVPVSTVAPAVLLSEIELQRSHRLLERPVILPPPWADEAPPPAAAAR